MARHTTDIYFRRVDASGSPIGSEVIVSFSSAAPLSPALIWNGAEYGLAWRDWNPQYGGIYFSRISALGVELAPDGKSISSTTADNPSIAWTGTGYGLAYVDSRDGNDEIYFALLDQYGSRMGSERRITIDPAISTIPVLAWTGSGFGIAWMDSRDGDYQVYFTRLDALGNKIGSDQRVSFGSPSSLWPGLIWNGTEYGLSWNGNGSGNQELYFARFDSSGTKIGSDVRVTNDPAPSVAPIACWNGLDYGMAWLNSRGGSQALYFTTVGCCNDLDLDGSNDCHDCDDGDPATLPGADQICGDGLNNDCDHPNWPEFTETNEVDDDGDGPNECAGDCDDTNPAVYPGAPEICDGANNDCNAPGWPAISPAEVNQDQDAYPLCNDCADQNALIYPGAPQLCDGINNDCNAPGWPAVPGTEIDVDGDGRIACGDWNDANPAVSPGAAQICGDGLNSDCSHPGWPALAGTNEVDDDGDGLSECFLDCDDSSSRTFPGAPEINDGMDNQCPGDLGFGTRDEVGTLAFSNLANPNELSWAAQAEAGSYEVARSGNPFPSASGFLQSVISTTSSFVDSVIPAVNGRFFYLVRPAGPFVGSWGQRSDGQERIGFASPESNCGDSTDNDADGQVDCADPDCVAAIGCVAATLTFVDTPGDDLPPTALSTFFQEQSLSPSDYIFLSLSGAGLVDFAFCAERADYYKDGYLSMAISGGPVSPVPGTVGFAAKVLRGVHP